MKQIFEVKRIGSVYQIVYKATGKVWDAHGCYLAESQAKTEAERLNVMFSKGSK